jgi:hypothetical protein
MTLPPHLDPRIILIERRGVLTSRRCRRTQTTVTLYDARIAEFDEAEGRWWTTCEDHSETYAHETKGSAFSALADPRDWCGTCGGGNWPRSNC